MRWLVECNQLLWSCRTKSTCRWFQLPLTDSISINLSKSRKLRVHFNLCEHELDIFVLSKRRSTSLDVRQSTCSEGCQPSNSYKPKALVDRKLWSLCSSYLMSCNEESLRWRAESPLHPQQIDGNNWLPVELCWLVDIHWGTNSNLTKVGYIMR